MPDSTREGAEKVVVDASAMVDLLVGRSRAAAVQARIEDAVLAAPAHLDLEVLSALGRMSRAGKLSAEEVDQRLAVLGRMPVTRHMLPGLLAEAWTRRSDMRLSDALYVELAAQLDVPLVTTDLRLAKATLRAEPITD
ncbi:MAG TPA: type II toxin-antitoxin system VapC family toxin [Pseudonocardiaceae bacterium]|jgi:predicted nucleic acid-binding protein|nr:type II toxin-antitoxin system VapC family toxin [Pseudonocardiaceae bacterium]